MVKSNKGVKFPIEILDKTEVSALLKTFGDSKISIRNRAIVMVMYRSLLRCSEMLDLGPADIDPALGTVRVRNGKGGHPRTVGIDEASILAIAAWQKFRPSSPYLFCTGRGSRLDSGYIRRMLKRQAKRAGIAKRVHPHNLRHTGACEMSAEGFEVRIISRQLGHRNLATTTVYLNHLSPRDLADAVRSRSAQHVLP